MVPRQRVYRCASSLTGVLLFTIMVDSLHITASSCLGNLNTIYEFLYHPLALS